MQHQSSYKQTGKSLLFTYHLSLITSIALMAMIFSIGAFAQGGTVSPYSQYALGEIAQKGGGLNQGMNGLGIGVHRSYLVNPLNPASYASVDSLTMLFDMGISGQLTSFNEKGKTERTKTANFEYVMGSFRLSKAMGLTFGILPMTNVGYKYNQSTGLETQNTVVTTYNGEGGIHQLFVGVGARPVKPLSVGVNVGYIWGGYDRSVVGSSGSTVNTLSKMYSASVNSYTLDFGLQYDQPIGKTDLLTVGLTYGLGHKLSADATCKVISTNSSVSKADTTVMTVANALELPHTIGAGFSYSHGTKWLVGADVQAQLWGKTSFPDYVNGQYALRSDLLDNSYRFTVGGEYCPRWNARNFFQRIRYRVGAGYTTPYYKINGQDGPRQISATVGFGIPIANGYISRTSLYFPFLNISAQYVNNNASGLIRENIFRINIGLTFNERWFAKWKVE
jgi:hypothetical protein